MSATHQIHSSKSSLPSQPSLERLRKDAKRQLAKLRTGGARVQLAEAQLLLAREYGFSSWRALKAAVEAYENSAPPSRPLLSQHRIPAHTAMLDRIGVENAFFNFMALGLFLACMVMPFDFGPHRTKASPAPTQVFVEFVR